MLEDCKPVNEALQHCNLCGAVLQIHERMTHKLMTLGLVKSIPSVNQEFLKKELTE